MTEYDLAIRCGTIITASSTMDCDIGVKDGEIVARSENRILNPTAFSRP